MESTRKKDSDLEMVDDTNRGDMYVRNIVYEYNQSPDKWKDIDKKVFFAASKNEVQTNESRCVIYIRNFEDLYELKINLINAFLSVEKKVYIRMRDQTIVYSAEKLQVPTKLLSDIFDKFAKNFRLTDNDFKPATLRFSDDMKEGILNNTHFIYFCLTIAFTMSHLLGNDGTASDDFKQNIEKLFNDKTICPGFLSIVDKLVNFERFRFLCNNIDKVNFAMYDVGWGCREYFLLSDFKNALQKYNLKLWDLFDKKISKIKTTESKIENTNPIEEKNITAPKLEDNKIIRKVLLWKNLILILLIGLAALASLIFGINIKFLFLAFITNPLSIIITVVAVVLFVGLTIYANKVKAIRLQKLCCGKESDGKSFFNIYRNIDDEMPDHGKNNNLIKE